MSDEMRRELNGLRAEMRLRMGELHKGMDELRGELRSGLGESRREMGESRREMGELKSMFRRTMIQAARMTGDLAEIKHELAANVATKHDVSLLLGRMDKFAGSQRDADFDSAKTAHRLDEHHRRLTRLETRRP
jgi:hypothetical protein